MVCSKVQCAILLLGFVAIVNSAGYGNRQYAPASSFVARVSPYSNIQKVAVVVEEPEEDEEVEVKQTPVRYSAPSYIKQSNDDYSRPPTAYSSSENTRQDNQRIADEQNQSAKYAFASAVDDGIQDQSQVRQETRDGLKVQGSYSYSDGFFKRTVRYEADEGGYRVVGEETEPIGAGPQIDLVNGKADVHTQVEGVNTQYSISASDIQTIGVNTNHRVKHVNP